MGVLIKKQLLKAETKHKKITKPENKTKMPPRLFFIFYILRILKLLKV